MQAGGSGGPPESVVLEEEFDPSYEPTEEEIREYAQFLGMDLERDKDLLWIAKEGLKAPLPAPWKPCRTGENEIYYFNFENGESVWEHPCDEFYKRVYQKEKEKQKGRSGGGAEAGGGFSAPSEAGRKKVTFELPSAGSNDRPASPLSGGSSTALSGLSKLGPLSAAGGMRAASPTLAPLSVPGSKSPSAAPGPLALNPIKSPLNFGAASLAKGKESAPGPSAVHAHVAQAHSRAGPRLTGHDDELDLSDGSDELGLGEELDLDRILDSAPTKGAPARGAGGSDPASLRASSGPLDVPNVPGGVTRAASHPVSSPAPAPAPAPSSAPTASAASKEREDIERAWRVEKETLQKKIDAERDGLIKSHEAEQRRLQADHESATAKVREETERLRAQLLKEESELQAKRAHSEAERAALETARKQAAEELAQLTAQRAARTEGLEKELVALRQKRTDEMKAALKALEEEEDRAKSEQATRLAALRAALADSEDQAKARAAEIATQSATLAALSQQKKDAQQQLDAVVERRQVAEGELRGLTSQIANKQDELRALSSSGAESGALQAQLEALRSQLAAAGAERDRLDRANTEAASALQAEQRRATEIADQLSAARRAAEARDREFATMRSRLEQLSRDKEQASQAAQTAQTQLAELTRARDAADSSRASDTEAAARLTQRIQGLERELEDKERQRTALSARCDQLTAELKQAPPAAAGPSDREAVLTRELEATRQRAQSLQTQVQSLQTQVQSLQTDRTSHQATVSDLTARLKAAELKAKSEAEQRGSAASEHHREITEARAQIADLKARLEQSTTRGAASSEPARPAPDPAQRELVDQVALLQKQVKELQALVLSTRDRDRDRLVNDSALPRVRSGDELGHSEDRERGKEQERSDLDRLGSVYPFPFEDQYRSAGRVSAAGLSSSQRRHAHAHADLPKGRGAESLAFEPLDELGQNDTASVLSELSGGSGADPWDHKDASLQSADLGLLLAQKQTLSSSQALRSAPAPTESPVRQAYVAPSLKPDTLHSPQTVPGPSASSLNASLLSDQSHSVVVSVLSQLKAYLKQQRKVVRSLQQSVRDQQAQWRHEQQQLERTKDSTTEPAALADLRTQWTQLRARKADIDRQALALNQDVRQLKELSDWLRMKLLTARQSDLGLASGAGTLSGSFEPARTVASTARRDPRVIASPRPTQIRVTPSLSSELPMASQLNLASEEPASPSPLRHPEDPAADAIVSLKRAVLTRKAHPLGQEACDTLLDTESRASALRTMVRRWAAEREGLRDSLHQHFVWLKSFGDRVRQAADHIQSDAAVSLDPPSSPLGLSASPAANGTVSNSAFGLQLATPSRRFQAQQAQQAPRDAQDILIRIRVDQGSAAQS